MRRLVAAGEDLDRDALVGLYAYPDPVPDAGWVRANMVSSLDGAVSGDDGLSGSIGTPADKRVFSVLRGLADVVVAGAGTVRAEGYSRPKAKPDDAGRRAGAGQAPQPCLAVVTASGEVPADLLDGPGRDESGWRLVVLAAASTDGDRLRHLRATLGDGCVVTAGDETVDPATALAALSERGLRRVLTEGGPSLLGRWLDGGVVDELCLTTAPRVVAGDAGRVVHGPALDLDGWQLAHLLEDGGTLLARWVRSSRPGGA